MEMGTDSLVHPALQNAGNSCPWEPNQGAGSWCIPYHNRQLHQLPYVHIPLSHQETGLLSPTSTRLGPWLLQWDLVGTDVFFGLSSLYTSLSPLLLEKMAARTCDHSQGASPNLRAKTWGQAGVGLLPGEHRFGGMHVKYMTLACLPHVCTLLSVNLIVHLCTVIPTVMLV